MTDSKIGRYHTPYCQGVFEAKDNDELQERYDAGAQGYEERVAKSGYIKKLPLMITGLLCRYVEPGDGTILDAGAGTGLIAEMIVPLGYKNIVGIDLSEGMLELARAKGIYKELRQMVLGETLDFPNDFFYASVASGVFNVNHAPPESFDELIRVTKPKGHIVFTVRDDAFEERGFKEKLELLESDNKWKLVDVTERVKRWSFTDQLGDDKMANRAFAYQVI